MFANEKLENFVAGESSFGDLIKSAQMSRSLLIANHELFAWGNGKKCGRLV